MNQLNTIPELTAEQQQALDAGNGVVQGPSYLLMRPNVVLDWFGYTIDELRGELQPALEQAERGEVAPWDLKNFLAKMHQQHEAQQG